MNNEEQDDRLKVIREKRSREQAEDEALKRKAYDILIRCPLWLFKQLALGFGDLFTLGVSSVRKLSMKETVQRKAADTPHHYARMAGAVAVCVFAVVLAFSFVALAAKNKLTQAQAEWAEQAETEKKRIEASKVWVCADCRLPIFKSDSEHVSTDAKNSLCSSCFQKRVVEAKRKAEENARQKAMDAKLLQEKQLVEEKKRKEEQAVHDTSHPEEVKERERRIEAARLAGANENRLKNDPQGVGNTIVGFVCGLPCTLLFVWFVWMIFKSNRCSICGVTLKRTHAMWRIAGKRVTVCANCNSQIARDKSRQAMKQFKRTNKLNE